MADRRANIGKYESMVNQAQSLDEMKAIMAQLMRDIQNQVDDILENAIHKEDLAEPLLQSFPKKAPKDSDVTRGRGMLHVDETNNKLMVTVRLSSGLLKTAEVNLT